MFEEKVIDLYPTDKIQSPVHLSIGQEAVAAGICECLSTRDLLFGTYRSHAYYIAKGGKLTEMMAEETITPKGVEMQEEVVEETPEQSSSAPLTYDELRLRLPPEVSDDVVKLLASSDEALLEFSNIATQQDVNEFNVKYGVELVLPQV